MKKKKKLIIALASVLLVCVIVPLFSSFEASAEMVDVYYNSGEELEFANIWGELCSVGAPDPEKSYMISQENGVIKMQTNSWAMFSPNDCISYAYTKSAFNAGDESVLKIQFTVHEWDGKEIGIALRESLDAGSPAILFSLRADSCFWLIRNEKDANYSYNSTAEPSVNFEEDVHFRLVIERERGRLSGYYKFGGTIGDIDDETGWIKGGNKINKKFANLTSLYTGIAFSNAMSGVSTCVASNFTVNLQAPEGYTIDNEGGGAEGDDEGTTGEPEVVLPEDFESPGDALLYETFTDGDIFPAEDKTSITNPLWTVRKGEATVLTDEDNTNRYLSVSYTDDPLVMTAGNMYWTDYSAQMNFMIPGEEVVETETNTIAFLFRHRSDVIGGSADYAVTIQNLFLDGKLQSQVLRLTHRGGQGTFIPTNPTTLQEVTLAEGEMIASDVLHTVKVTVIDNQIKVYFDDLDTPVISYVDERTGKGLSNDPHLQGCIGIYTDMAVVQFDDIIVRKESDPLGGDYDNEIMGNYDEPIPEWIEKNYADSYGY